MIQVLLSWAVDYWHVIESRIALLTLSRVDGPVSALGLDSRHFLALLEGVVREDAGRAARLDDVYSEAFTPPPPPVSDAERRAMRRAEINRVAAAFG